MKIGSVTRSNHSINARNRLKSVNLKPVAQISGAGSTSQPSRSTPSADSSPSQSQSQSKSSEKTPSFGSSNRAAVISGKSNPSTDNGSKQSARGQTAPKTAKNASGNQASSEPGNLSAKERRKVQRLRRIDAKVRAHEQAHLAAAGQYAQGGASYEYVTGPNGKKYAVAGEVSMDTSSAGSPKETIQKMRQVKRAATAPANPSSQDQQVAAQATQQLASARQKLNQKQFEENGSGGLTGTGTESSKSPSDKKAPSGSSPSSDQPDNASNNGQSPERPGDIGVSVSQSIESYIQNQRNTPAQSKNNPASNNTDPSSNLSSSTNETSSTGKSPVTNQFLNNTADGGALLGAGQSLNLLA